MDADINRIQQEIRSINSDTVNKIRGTLDLLAEIYGQVNWSIYELVENSDNVGSKNVVFEIDGNRLFVINDGLRFTGEDFERICSVNTSVNRDSLVDRSFGLGFKSVFNFSNDVSIFSGNNGIRFFEESGLPLWKIFPHVVDCLELKSEQSTVFKFVLGNKRKQIADVLVGISPEILLFLNSVESLTVRDVQNNNTLLLEKSSKPLDGTNTNLVTVKRSTNKETTESSEYVCYSKDFSIPERVRIGENSETKVIVAVPVSGLNDSVSVFRNIYRVTGEEKTGFMLSGEFVTTMNFDGIVDNDWNSWLLDSVLGFVNSELKLRTRK